MLAFFGLAFAMSLGQVQDVAVFGLKDQVHRATYLLGVTLQGLG